MFDRLKQWENKLDSCIRCSYCLEHCPVYKYTRWESDAPRAKLAVLHGLIAGEIEISREMSERLFECYYCKRCENSCSAGIPLTEIFTDARLDFTEAGFAGEGLTVWTDTAKCVKCFACVNVCPHEARIYKDGKMTTDPAACQGCGMCVDVCSAKGISMYREMGTSSAEMYEKVRDYITNAPENGKVVIFACNWSTFPGMQNTRGVAGIAENRDEVFVSMCTGRLKTDMLLRILELGAAGILIAGCPEDECEHKGSTYIQKRMPAVKETLQRAGIHPERVRFREVPKGDAAAFTAAYDEYAASVRGNFTDKEKT
jgi:coenzyme F420-reducing hydrogenase delta subunit/Pyruvate/2-oxoacid:ferredoxin oxidoreductase delta subunit